MAEPGRTAERYEGDAWFVGYRMIDDATVGDGRQDCAIRLHGGHNCKAVLLRQEGPNGFERGQSHVISPQC